VAKCWVAVVRVRRPRLRGRAWMTATQEWMFGGDLLSHPVARAVPSALTGLASGFGMEPGVSPSLWPPKLYGDVTGPPVARAVAGGVGGVRFVSREPHSGRETVSATATGGGVGVWQVVGLLVLVSFMRPWSALPHPAYQPSRLAGSLSP
jgi:hypothetical protein